MSATPALYPTHLERSGDDRLRITWSDGLVLRYTFQRLRESCPCATCREKRKQPPPSPAMLPILAPHEAAPLKIDAMRPVGNYAYAIAFSDGHDTGIFSFELLRKLGEPADDEGQGGTGQQPGH